VYHHDIVDFLRAVADALAQARLPAVAAAIALHLAGLLVTGQRWRSVIDALGSRLTLMRATLINLAGIFVRNATPTTGLGGDASRILLLRSEGLSLTRATAAFAYVRLAEIPAIAVVVACSAPAVAALLQRSSKALLIAAVIAAIAALVLWLRRDWLRRQAAALSNDARHVRIGRGAVVGAILYASIAQAETLARQIVVAAACGMPLTIQQSATISAMAIVGGFVPTVGSVGAIDGSIAAGLMLFGADAHTAITITLIERVISYGFSTAAGAAALAVLGGRSVLAKYHGAR